MLMEDYFGVVDRAFIREANRVLTRSRLELRTPTELPLPVPDRRRLPERRRLDRRHSVTRWHYTLGGAAGMLGHESANMNLSPEFRSLLERL
jgi:hypothetical protein